MRVRNSMIVLAAVALTALTDAPAAYAQGSTPPPAPKAAAAIVPVAPALPAADRIFTPPVDVPTPTPPTVLGAGWAWKLRAALDGVKHFLDEERLEAQQAIRARDVVGRPTRPAPVVPVWRAAWTPASALRDAVYEGPAQLTPVPIEPPTESLVDTRGEHGVLLGIRIELPWMVP